MPPSLVSEHLVDAGVHTLDSIHAFFSAVHISLPLHGSVTHLLFWHVESMPTDTLFSQRGSSVSTHSGGVSRAHPNNVMLILNRYIWGLRLFTIDLIITVCLVVL